MHRGRAGLSFLGKLGKAWEMYWCARLGSNQQPLPSEGSTLSIELRARMSGGTAFHIQNNGCRAAASPKQYLFSADSSTARTRPPDNQALELPRQNRRNPG